MTLKDKIKQKLEEIPSISRIYHHARKIEKITDEFAIEFHKWSFENVIYCDGFYVKTPLGEKYSELYSTEELLEIFKKEKKL